MIKLNNKIAVKKLRILMRTSGPPCKSCSIKLCVGYTVTPTMTPKAVHIPPAVFYVYSFLLTVYIAK